MSIKFTKLTRLSQILFLGTIASMFAVSATAETKESTSVEQRFEDAYFSHGKNAFAQSNILGQIDTLLGFTGFPEQHISRDAKTVDNLYQETMAKQSSLGSRIITRDVANPYDTSLRENSGYSAIE